MNESKKITFDSVCNILPLDRFQAVVMTGFVGGALYSFIDALVGLGFDKKQLRSALKTFADANHFDLDDCDPRFWESLVDGLLQIKEFGYPQLSKSNVPVREGKAQPPRRVSRYKYLESTLPPYREGRDRKVTFEDDGTIVYAKEDGDWEPPRDISGYERDVNDPWMFHPLWPECIRQHGIAMRKSACGCINIVMRCNNRQAPHFRDVLEHTDCLACEYRQQPEKGEIQ